MNLLVIGSLPPPYHGTSIYLQKLITLFDDDSQIAITCIDTSSHKNSISSFGRLNIANIVFGINAVTHLFRTLIFKKIDIVYIPVSQNYFAYLRDGVIICLSAIFKKKIVIHLHGSHFKRFYETSNSFG